jgi:hypothetical protein
MITAANYLETAGLHGDEKDLFTAAVKEIEAESEAGKREYCGFKVKMSQAALTANVIAAIRIHYRKDGWDVQPQQMQEQSPLDGSVSIKWVVLVMPADEVSFAATVRFKGRNN